MRTLVERLYQEPAKNKLSIVTAFIIVRVEIGSGKARHKYAEFGDPLVGRGRFSVFVSANQNALAGNGSARSALRLRILVMPAQWTGLF